MNKLLAQNLLNLRGTKRRDDARQRQAHHRAVFRSPFNLKKRELVMGRIDKHIVANKGPSFEAQLRGKGPQYNQRTNRGAPVPL